ncbi:MAG TPA: hypothetical protein PK668_26055 [Myxococcota bacterium]|nr:hypothetical protein [Myxococcota bacterium]HRY96990.1 hypothetical protein [Myxococcota bacterium]HSA23677.1 hypothetical protein [Myxococcota bacterium]
MLTNHASTSVLVFSVLALGLIAGACGSGSEPFQTEPAIRASDQQLTAANEVLVASASSDGPGWATIHADEAGAPGAVLGFTAVPDGQSSQVAVTLERDATDGETLWAMLHLDAGTLGTYEFPGADVPVTDAQGAMVMESFSVTLAPPPEPAIAAAAQTLDDLSTVVLVQSATSVGLGWVTIHEDDAGSPGLVLGHAHLDAGTTASVAVVLDRPAVNGETLHAMLHLDEGTPRAYEFPGVDVPATDGQGGVVMAPFLVTVPVATPAVRLTLGASGTTDYRVVSAEPTDLAGGLGVGLMDPALSLRAGWRYEVVNQAAGSHPFELVTRGAIAAQDTVLLSASASGSLEGDAAVHWTEVGGTLGFTLAGGLSAALDGYRCAFHPASMRGTMAVE